MPIQRLNYFHHQFLQVEDFNAEQDYHKLMRRWHNEKLHTYGIGEGGLKVEVDEAYNVNITAGWALDITGREIIVEKDIKKNLTELTKESNLSLDQGIYLTITYSEEPTNPTNQEGVTGEDNTFSRMTESFLIKAYSTSDKPFLDLKENKGKILILAKLKLEDGEVKPYYSDVTIAGATLGASSVPGIRFSVEKHGGEEWPELKGLEVSDPGSGLQGIQVNSTQTNFSGNVEVNEKLKVVKGFEIEGVLKGVEGEGEVKGLAIEGAVEIKDSQGSVLSCKGIAEKDASGKYGVLGQLKEYFEQESGYHSAAIVGVSEVEGVYGVYASAPDGTYALYVNGTSYFRYDIGKTDKRVPNLYVDNLVTNKINGNLYQSGHFVDKFINASGQALKTGDVVKLKGTPVIRFQGNNNSIPVAEVCLADKENDTRLIGVVSNGAIRESDIHDTGIEPEDPACIEDGKELFVVALGAFARCKADATDAPIDVGDLLTSSSNPGHAKKAIDPKIGSVIGKALEPLKEGTGYIAVFVNLQ